MDLVDIVTGDGTRIAEDCGGTSGVDFRLILGLENDWAAVDSPLSYHPRSQAG
jgi:hypothetical protein